MTYFYGMRLRPAGLGTIPDGQLAIHQGYVAPRCVQKCCTMYGVVEYARRLSDDELRKWEMFRLGDELARFEAFLDVLVRIVVRQQWTASRVWADDELLRDLIWNDHLVGEVEDTMAACKQFLDTAMPISRVFSEYETLCRKHNAVPKAFVADTKAWKDYKEWQQS